MLTMPELLEKVEQTLADCQFSAYEPKDLYEPVDYTLALGGKRIRPVLCCAACQAFNHGDPSPALKVAVALEVYHNFTLLHDDLMDNSPTRRGKDAVHKKWDANQAILSGDAMSILAFKILADAYPAEPLKAIMPHFAQLALEVCDGQQYDMAFEHRMDVTEAEYLNMIRLKTAVLLGGALRIGGLLGGASASDAQYLYDAGINLGLAFQLQDDWLDVYADEATLGKPTGGDIVNNKKTMLLIRALNNATGRQHKDLLHYLSWSENKRDKKIQAVTHLYDELGIGDEVAKMVNDYTDKALLCLEHLTCGREAVMPIIRLAEKLRTRNK